MFRLSENRLGGTATRSWPKRGEKTIPELSTSPLVKEEEEPGERYNSKGRNRKTPRGRKSFYRIGGPLIGPEKERGIVIT